MANVNAAPDYETLVMKALRDKSGVQGEIQTASEICSQLGVCGGDLHDLVEFLFITLDLELPENNEVVAVPYQEDVITVSDLAAFLRDIATT